MPEDDDEPVLEESCFYVCNGTEYVLTGGSGPPGYHCIEFYGSCTSDEEGTVLHFPPVPWEDIPYPPGDPLSPPPEGQGMYRYSPKLDELGFASANRAPANCHYLGRVTLSNLKELFPEVATSAEAMKASLPGKSFNIAIPAVPNESKPK